MMGEPGWRFGMLHLTRHVARFRQIDRAYAQTREGRGYFRQGQYERALRYFNEAIAQAPNYAEAHIGRGRTYYALQQYERARADFTSALLFDRKAFEAHFWLGQTLYVLHEYQEALTAYNRALQIHTKDAAAHNSRGQVYFHLQEYQRALADFERALKLSPQFALAFTNRGLTYLALRQFTKALRDFHLALALDPAQRRAYVGSGQAFFILKDYARSLTFYRRALQIVPTCQVYNNLGVSLDARRERLQAIEAYTRAIELDPTQYVPYNNRGWSHYAMHDFAAAQADFEQAIALSPTDAYDAYLNLAWTLAERGRYADALDECNHVLLWGIKDAQAYAHRARIYCWKGDYEQGLADCARALQLDSTSAEAHGVHGLIAYQQKRYAEASTAFEKARKLGHDLFWLDEAEQAARDALQPIS